MAGGFTSPNPSSFTVYVDVNEPDRVRRQGVPRAAVAGGLIAVTMLLALAFNSSAPQPASLAATESHTSQKVQRMEAEYAHRETIYSVIHKATGHLGQDAKVLAQNLAFSTKPVLAGATKQQLAADCARSATYGKILGHFTELQTNLTDDKAYREKLDKDLKVASDDAYDAWIDQESTYREAASKKKTAEEAATFASGEFEKYKTAVATAEQKIQDDILPTEAEKQSLITQKAIVGTITELIKGMNTAATSTEKAARLAEVKVDIAQLETQKVSKGSKTNLAKLKKMTSNLAAVSADTITQALEILADLEAEMSNRITEITTAADNANTELNGAKAEKMKWEIKVVETSNTADKARADMQSADLKRQNLNGIYTVRKKNYEDLHASFDVDIAQYTSELAAVGTILGKVNEIVAACKAA